MQASFRKKYDYGYFYFRNSAHVEENLQDVEPIQHDSVLSFYKPESEYAARKLRELKQQTIDTGMSTQYKCKLVWTKQLEQSFPFQTKSPGNDCKPGVMLGLKVKGTIFGFKFFLVS